MTEENIRIVVHDDGRIEFETHDIKGDACLEELEEILGKLVDDLNEATKTSEYHEPATRKNTNSSGNKQRQEVDLNEYCLRSSSFTIH